MTSQFTYHQENNENRQGNRENQIPNQRIQNHDQNHIEKRNHSKSGSRGGNSQTNALLSVTNPAKPQQRGNHNKSFKNQLRSQFIIFKQFIDTIIALNKSFKTRFGGSTRRVSSLPFFALRDRFLIEFQTDFREFIKSRLKRFRRALKKVEADDSDPALSRSSISEFDKDVKQIIRTINKKCLDMLDGNNKAMFSSAGDAQSDTFELSQNSQFLGYEIDQFKQFILDDEPKFGGFGQQKVEKKSSQNDAMSHKVKYYRQGEGINRAKSGKGVGDVGELLGIVEQTGVGLSQRDCSGQVQSGEVEESEVIGGKKNNLLPDNPSFVEDWKSMIRKDGHSGSKGQKDGEEDLGAPEGPENDENTRGAANATSGYPQLVKRDSKVLHLQRKVSRTLLEQYSADKLDISHQREGDEDCAVIEKPKRVVIKKLRKQPKSETSEIKSQPKQAKTKTLKVKKLSKDKITKISSHNLLQTANPSNQKNRANPPEKSMKDTKGRQKQSVEGFEIVQTVKPPEIFEHSAEEPGMIAGTINIMKGSLTSERSMYNVPVFNNLAKSRELQGSKLTQNLNSYGAGGAETGIRTTLKIVQQRTPRSIEDSEHHTLQYSQLSGYVKEKGDDHKIISIPDFRDPSCEQSQTATNLDHSFRAELPNRTEIDEESHEREISQITQNPKIGKKQRQRYQTPSLGRHADLEDEEMIPQNPSNLDPNNCFFTYQQNSQNELDCPQMSLSTSIPVKSIVKAPSQHNQQLGYYHDHNMVQIVTEQAQGEFESNQPLHLEQNNQESPRLHQSSGSGASPTANHPHLQIHKKSTISPLTEVEEEPSCFQNTSSFNLNNTTFELTSKYLAASSQEGGERGKDQGVDMSCELAEGRNRHHKSTFEGLGESIESYPRDNDPDEGLGGASSEVPRARGKEVGGDHLLDFSSKLMIFWLIFDFFRY